ncbi:MAG: hypothetical protein KF812_09065 [Fimbriimonadaceae bacterium]|nr:hypothetical protein [Fimbriimonadaceae bacterium]
MSTRFNKRMPYLNGFLKYAMNDPVQGRMDLAVGLSVVGGLLTPAAFGVTAGVMTQNVGLGFLAAFLTLGGWIAAGITWGKRAKQPRSEKEKAQVAAVAASKPWQSLRNKQKLHKYADPAVLHLLEAAAYHWTRVQTIVTSPTWNADSLPGHWAQVRDSAQMAADQAMAELLHMSQLAMGEPSRSREDEVSGMVKDLFELQISDALDGLRQISSSDWTAYSHSSPHAGDIVKRGMTVADRLQNLAEELEGATPQTATMVGSADVPNSAQSLEAVLSELKAVRQAEEEVTLQNRLGG